LPEELVVTAAVVLGIGVPTVRPWVVTVVLLYGAAEVVIVTKEMTEEWVVW